VNSWVVQLKTGRPASTVWSMHDEFAALCADSRFADLSLRLRRGGGGGGKCTIQVGHSGLELEVIVQLHAFAAERGLAAQLRETGMIELSSIRGSARGVGTLAPGRRESRNAA